MNDNRPSNIVAEFWPREGGTETENGERREALEIRLEEFTFRMG